MILVFCLNLNLNLLLSNCTIPGVRNVSHGLKLELALDIAVGLSVCIVEGTA